MNEHPIVLFDGICNYCNRMVNFAINNDRNARLRFVASQTEKGMALRKQFQVPEEINSVIFIEGEKISYHSTAAIRIAKYLQGPAKLLFAFIIVPRFIREPVYKWVARNRYKWFGKRESCMIPTPEVRERFL